MASVTPLIYADGKHVPAPSGSTLDPALIDTAALVSTDADNALAVGDDGKLKAPAAPTPVDLVSAQAGNQLVTAVDGKLFVPEPSAAAAADLVSAQADNQLTTALDGKLFVPEPSPVNPADLVSTDTGNAVTTGTDGKLFAPQAATTTPADLVSAAEGNQLEVAIDGKLNVPPLNPASLISDATGNKLTTDTSGKLLVETESLESQISADAGNAISVGTDFGLYARAVSGDADNLVQRGADFGAKLTASDLVSAGSAGNLLTVNETDKRLQVDTATVTELVSDRVTVVSADANNLIRKGTDKGAFLDADALPDQVSAGIATTVTDGRVDVNYGSGLKLVSNALAVDEDALNLFAVSATDKILKLSNKVLSATVGAVYDAATGMLTLTGTDAQQLSQVYIPGASSSLKGVALVKDPAGQPAGTYFVYTFVTTAGETSLYVQVPEGSTVAAGNGIAVATADGVSTVSVYPRPSGGVLVDGTGVAVDTDVIASKAALDTVADDLAALSDRVDDLSASTMSVSGTAPDPAAMDNGTTVLYPASDLLS